MKCETEGSFSERPDQNHPSKYKMHFGKYEHFLFPPILIGRH